MVKVRVPATVANIGPGFDCLAMAVTIYNVVEAKPQAQLEIAVEGEGAESLPQDSRNLVYRAVERLFKEAGGPLPGLKLRLVNQIPRARGLGSSAAAIVGGLMAANLLAGEVFTLNQLFELAVEMEGHPDNVAAAIYGGLTVSYLQEGSYKAESFKPKRKQKVLLLIPDVSLSTRQARSVLPSKVNLDEAVFNLSRVGLLVGAFLTGREELFGPATEDKLHQPYRAHLIPHFEELIPALKEKGVGGVALSGAGPSLVCFVSSGQEEGFAAEVERLVEKWEQRYQLAIVDIDLEGAKVISSRT